MQKHQQKKDFHWNFALPAPYKYTDICFTLIMLKKRRTKKTIFKHDLMGKK
jgi:hypothetical protein